jgi:cytoskeleton protein RodZ
VFEIGNSLREARQRQGIEFARIESDTKIRSKYLQALEEERFELLPGETYVKGFLRAYAEYLGLDGQLYVDEYNTRFATVEEPLVSPSPPRRPPGRRVESNLVVVTLAGIVAVTVLVIVALTGLGGNGQSTEPILTNRAPTTTQKARQQAVQPPASTARPAVRRARLVLVAARGACWMSVWAATAAGKRAGGRPLYEGTLEAGQSQRFARRALWIELGNPANLNVRLNGRRVRNIPQEQSVVVVTAKGVRTVSTA